MPDNPYDPPSAPIADERALAIEGSGTFDLSTCVTEAWDDTWRNFPLWLGVVFVATLAFLLSGITVIGLVVIWPVLGWGLVLFFLNMTDQRASFSDLFAGFSSYGNALVGMLVLMILLNLLALVGQSVQYVGQVSGSEVLTGIGVVVNLVWSFAVMLRLYFAILYLVDRGLDPTDAMRASWDATRGQTLRLAALALASAVVMILGVLALVVGVIPAVVMTYLMWTSAYRQMVGS
jgi:uncharacterized membrane protein